MNIDSQSYTIIRFIINIHIYTYAMDFVWRTRDLRASQQACVLCDAMKPVKHYDCNGVRRRSVNKTLSQYMLTKPHTKAHIIIFHEIHTSFIQYASYFMFRAIHIFLWLLLYSCLYCSILLFPYIRSYLSESNSPVNCPIYFWVQYSCLAYRTIQSQFPNLVNYSIHVQV